ncbi:hypothetical protein TNCV_4849701 [Trichonephila clavipes]|nr:hypothetical protein TNCV_4849701 [Trichonephila clavipes]
MSKPDSNRMIAETTERGDGDETMTRAQERNASSRAPINKTWAGYGGTEEGSIRTGMESVVANRDAVARERKTKLTPRGVGEQL